jgi:hypothetical protein
MKRVNEDAGNKGFITDSIEGWTRRTGVGTAASRAAKTRRQRGKSAAKAQQKREPAQHVRQFRQNGIDDNPATMRFAAEAETVAHFPKPRHARTARRGLRGNMTQQLKAT